MNKPIVRHESLQSLSHEHHHGLKLCWKIRTGGRLNVEVERIKSYADWFFETNLLPHFEAEEKLMFPILGNDHELIKKALAEHRRLKRLFQADKDLEKKLNLIEEQLESHIRFEERILFNEIQKVATPDQLKMIDENHSTLECGLDWPDRFWEKN